MNARLVFFVVALLISSGIASAQTLRPVERQLRQMSFANLASAARTNGDARRGAIVFHQPYAACTRCHSAGTGSKPLGPDLTRLPADATDEYLVESILEPSKKIRKEYQPLTIVTVDGKTHIGLLTAEDADSVTLRVLNVANTDGQNVVLRKSAIEEREPSTTSIMPKGLVAQLTSRQAFLDLVSYLIAIRDGGPARAKELQPPPSAYAARPLPEYENNIDHASMITSRDNAAFKRGQEIYNRLCINCHGDHTKPGSLPTSLRFASGKFRNGSDPFSMYQTITRGFGMMVPQTWMVPQQKYDVIHYIREAYLKDDNPTQYARVDDSYLRSLPAGTERGPAPRKNEPWLVMDYGPSLTHSYEVGRDASNFAQKGVAVRLDSGPGGVSRGQNWMVFDEDTLRVAAAWSGEGFVNWQGIMFDGRHNVHPRVEGKVQFENLTGPGWARPGSHSFEDDRVVGRDGRHYGPLPRDWAQYKGMYHYEDRTIVNYTVGEADVLEMPGLDFHGETPLYTRTFNIGPRSEDMLLQVAHHRNPNARLTVGPVDGVEKPGVAVFGPANESASALTEPQFDGKTWLTIPDSNQLDMQRRDFTVAARIRTMSGGTIFSQAPQQGEWKPDGKTLFISGGRLTFDIGWVGEVASKKKINDGEWHDVALTWKAQSGEVRLYIDGKADGNGFLKPKKRFRNGEFRIGYTTEDFPRSQSVFEGEIGSVAFFSTAKTDLDPGKRIPANIGDAAAAWAFKTGINSIHDLSGNGHDAKLVRQNVRAKGQVVAGLVGAPSGTEWFADESDLRLRIPAGERPVAMRLWTARVEGSDEAGVLAGADIDQKPVDALVEYTNGGSPRWPQELLTQPLVGNDDGAFAVDVLTHPAPNPWLSRVRLAGLDFYPDGKRMAVCTWDGDVWIVSGIHQRNGPLTWKRIASGLFQPLGLRVIDEVIHLTCRDQLCVLHDLNGDGETDFYKCLNNDHQVTEHFHEFAMGLQTDEEGNFYYAKSARHALKAVVPHHGTLLKVSKDGQTTEILANGFRAANGVCLNPDGSFIVTDQEGHWNPKNRINWVREGGFYGNMFGYHDVTDESDSAMEQPLCWITNAFDRSPSELLWVNSPKWGPLDGSLLNFSYGYGKVYVVPHEELDGQMQGGMCELPLPQFPTGVMRGRFHPQDGHLYTCGMFAWAGTQHQPGGLYRIRATGKPMYLPVGLKATESGMQISFTDELGDQNADDFRVSIWSLKRTKSYGSKHYDQRDLVVSGAEVSSDRRTVTLTIPEIQPTWCMEIAYTVTAVDGRRVKGKIHNTVHRLYAAAEN